MRKTERGSLPLARFLVAVLVGLIPITSEANELVNGGFEGAAPVILLPNVVGVWAADPASKVSVENGITPFEGTSMLRFDQTFWDCATGSGTGGNLFQIVNVPACADSAHLSAWVNRVDLNAQTDTQFNINIYAFDGSPDEFDDGFNVLPPFLANESVSLLSDADLATWEEITASLVIPDGTTYVGIHIGTTENVFDDLCPLTEFDGHYADDVELTFTCAPDDPTLADSGIALLVLLLGGTISLPSVRRAR